MKIFLTLIHLVLVYPFFSDKNHQVSYYPGIKFHTIKIYTKITVHQVLYQKPAKRALDILASPMSMSHDHLLL